MVLERTVLLFYPVLRLAFDGALFQILAFVCPLPTLTEAEGDFYETVFDVCGERNECESFFMKAARERSQLIAF